MDPKQYKWDDMAREDLAPGLGRKFLWGEKGMVAQVFIDKGVKVARHAHVAEQITYIQKGALRLDLGENGERSFTVRAGGVLVIPSNVPHAAEALEDTLDLDIFSPPRADWISGQDAYLRTKK